MWGDSCPMSRVTREPTAESRPVLPDAAVCAGDENAGRAPRVVGVPSRSFRGDTCLADALHRLVRVGEAFYLTGLSSGSQLLEADGTRTRHPGPGSGPEGSRAASLGTLPRGLSCSSASVARRTPGGL